jgi:hypothetical protein
LVALDGLNLDFLNIRHDDGGSERIVVVVVLWNIFKILDDGFGTLAGVGAVTSSTSVSCDWLHYRKWVSSSTNAKNILFDLTTSISNTFDNRTVDPTQRFSAKMAPANTGAKKQKKKWYV